MPDQYRVILSPEAIANLADILHYIEQDSEQNAIRMVDRIYRECGSLELFPQRYAVDRRGKQLPYEIRLMPVPPYRVIYRIVEEQRVVRILTIRHGRRKQWP